jgi:hypothetical protein
MLTQVQLPTWKYVEKGGSDRTDTRTLTDTRTVECGVLPRVTLDKQTVGISMGVSKMCVRG